MSDTIESRWRARAEEIRAEWRTEPVTSIMLKLGEEMAREAREENAELRRQLSTLHGLPASDKKELADFAAFLGMPEANMQTMADLRARLAAAESALASARDKAIEECARAAEEVCVGTVRYEHRALFAKVIRSLRAARPAEEIDQPNTTHLKGPIQRPGLAAVEPEETALDDVQRLAVSSGGRGPHMQGGVGCTSSPTSVPHAPPPKADGAEQLSRTREFYVDDSPLLDAARAQGKAEVASIAEDILRSIESGHLASIGGINNTYEPQIWVETVKGWRASLAALSRPSAPARAEKERGA